MGRPVSATFSNAGHRLNSFEDGTVHSIQLFIGACIILVNLNFKQEFHITLNFILK